MDSLPSSLAYLAPVLDDMATVDPAELDESYDASALLQALKERTTGLSLAAARRRIRDDRESLVDWLTGKDAHPGHFVAAFIEAPEIVELARQAGPPRKAKPKPARASFRVDLDVPEGFKSVAQKAAIVLLRSDAGIVVTPTTAEAQAEAAAPLRTLPGTKWSEIAMDKTTGTICEYVGRVFFWLSVGGFAVDVSADFGGRAADEGLLRGLIASLRIVSR